MTTKIVASTSFISFWKAADSLAPGQTQTCAQRTLDSSVDNCPDRLLWHRLFFVRRTLFFSLLLVESVALRWRHLRRVIALALRRMNNYWMTLFNHFTHTTTIYCTIVHYYLSLSSLALYLFIFTYIYCSTINSSNLFFDFLRPSVQFRQYQRSHQVLYSVNTQRFI